MNISTALSSITSGLRQVGSALVPVAQTAIAAAPAFAPLIAQAIAKKPRGMTPYYGGDMQIATGFMPGGPTLPGIAAGGLGALIGMGSSGMLSADPYGGLRSPLGSSQCITPTVVAQRLMLPRIVNVPNPNNPSVIETYVKAPRVKYRVSVSRAGGHRRCSGGR